MSFWDCFHGPDEPTNCYSTEGTGNDGHNHEGVGCLREKGGICLSENVQRTADVWGGLSGKRMSVIGVN